MGRNKKDGWRLTQTPVGSRIFKQFFLSYTYQKEVSWKLYGRRSPAGRNIRGEKITKPKNTVGSVKTYFDDFMRLGYLDELKDDIPSNGVSKLGQAFKRTKSIQKFRANLKPFFEYYEEKYRRALTKREKKVLTRLFNPRPEEVYSGEEDIITRIEKELMLLVYDKQNYARQRLNLFLSIEKPGSFWELEDYKRRINILEKKCKNETKRAFLSLIKNLIKYEERIDKMLPAKIRDDLEIRYLESIGYVRRAKWVIRKLAEEEEKRNEKKKITKQ